jgi:phospholipase/lecithinase/hemolysin
MVATRGLFDRIVVFGDSLSDGGNAGRFSNGPVWVELLGTQLGLTVTPSRNGGSNFAVGGARLDPRSGPGNMRAQADLYLARQPAAESVLFVVYGGGNDLLAAAQNPNANGIISSAAASLKSIVSDLAEQGATDILVPNLPDVGMTPAISAYGPRAVAQAGILSDRLNAAVDRALAEIASRHALHRLDVRAMAERARADPGSYGFVDVRTPCILTGRCEGYLFWDHVHPTTHAHARLADAAAELVLGR